ncbi:HYR domain-containing protein [Corallococcus llansteffanensis]|uniref:HYR domain-containing protein n=1 Tax=Corallococcus llansteffanensis TaxID=2316731 RepID=A0A3A8PKL0_9BACT|nr:HYR domain-containing protein [Corallococcus llansteffanensis]RKH56926.1 HYR domain-containing protein [Corallococcus llansteffanensis]
MRLLPVFALLLPVLVSCSLPGTEEASARPALAHSAEGLTGGVGPPVLLGDYRTSGVYTQDNADFMGAAGGKVFFRNADSNGFEPWVTDGTPEGTHLLADFNPGSSGSLYFLRTVPFGSRLMLPLHDGVHGLRWWVSDGTPEGTRLINTPGADPTSVVTPAAVVMNGIFYFIVDNGVLAWELWRSDGTDEGTWRLAESQYGQYNHHEVDSLEVVGDVLYFSSSNKLYRSDGTSEGTRLVYAVNDSAHSLELDLFVLGGRLYFFSGYSSNWSLWSSDGTGPGTLFITSAWSNLVGVDGDRVFFEKVSGSGSSRTQSLYVTRGVAGSTTLLKSVSSNASWNYAQLFGKVGDQLIFGWSSSAAGSEPWRTDGTTAGTVLLKDLVPGTASSEPVRGAVLGDSVYFLSDTATGSALWRTDGTADGTVEVKAFTAKLPAGTELRKVGAALVFVANDGVTGDEPWASDGTADGTLPLGDLNPGAAGSALAEFVVTGTRLHFLATVGGKKEVWATDGTVAGTRRVRAVDPTLYLAYASDTLGRAFFSAVEDNQARLWLSDGTVTDLPPLLVMPVSNGSSNPVEFLSVGATAYFVPDQDTPRVDPIVRTDGTPAGTREVIALHYGRSSEGDPARLTLFNGKLWFKLGFGLYAGDPEAGTATGIQMSQNLSDFKPAGTKLVGLWWQSPNFQLWTHTGSATGSTRIASYYDSPFTFLARLVPVGDSLLYSYLNTSAGRWDLLRTNGTSSGTVRVAQLLTAPESVTSAGSLAFYVTGGALWRTDATASGTLALTATQGRAPENLQVAGGLLFFTATESGVGREPWVSDGTQAGTHRVADFQPGAGSTTLVAAVLHHGTRYLLLRDWEGAFLVRTDGTPAGTVKVAEAPGATWLVSRGGALLFDGADRASGQEPRVYLPGASAATLLADVNPGPASSAPGVPVFAGSRLVFAATTMPEGREPFAVEVDTTPPTVSHVLEGTLGRGGFYRSDVSVRFTATDVESGTALGTLGCEPLMVTSDTPGQAITCTASSLGGVTTRTVTVRRDLTPPQVTCPQDLVVTEGATPAYGVTAMDVIDASPVVAVTPANVLPVGQHVIRAEATDAAGNSATCQFQVTVLARVEADAGTDAGTGTDAGVIPDAGTATDAGTNGNGTPPPGGAGPGDADSGCGCSGSGSNSAASIPLLLFGLSWLTGRRRMAQRQ